MTVSYRYQLDDVPVFGPGAKIRVSYANREVCELARFWRHEEPGDPVAVIPPDEAVSRLGADDRFAALGDGGMSGVITRFELGYYAAGPRFFQRFLVPVYKAEGRIEGGALDDDRFRVYVTAVDGDADQVKEAGVRARSSYREVFTGF